VIRLRGKVGSARPRPADILAKLVNGWPARKLDELLPWIGPLSPNPMVVLAPIGQA
jgi:hypothetical protein